MVGWTGVSKIRSSKSSYAHGQKHNPASEINLLTTSSTYRWPHVNADLFTTTATQPCWSHSTRLRNACTCGSSTDESSSHYVIETCTVSDVTLRLDQGEALDMCKAKTQVCLRNDLSGLWLQYEQRRFKPPWCERTHSGNAELLKVEGMSALTVSAITRAPLVAFCLKPPAYRLLVIAAGSWAFSELRSQTCRFGFVQNGCRFSERKVHRC